MMLNMARPIGLFVSTWSWTLTKRTPRWSTPPVPQAGGASCTVDGITARVTSTSRQSLI